MKLISKFGILIFIAIAAEKSVDAGGAQSTAQRNEELEFGNKKQNGKLNMELEKATSVLTQPRGDILETQLNAAKQRRKGYETFDDESSVGRINDNNKNDNLRVNNKEASLGLNNAEVDKSKTQIDAQQKKTEENNMNEDNNRANRVNDNNKPDEKKRKKIKVNYNDRYELSQADWDNLNNHLDEVKMEKQGYNRLAGDDFVEKDTKVNNEGSYQNYDNVEKY